MARFDDMYTKMHQQVEASQGMLPLKGHGGARVGTQGASRGSSQFNQMSNTMKQQNEVQNGKNVVINDLLRQYKEN